VTDEDKKREQEEASEPGAGDEAEAPEAAEEGAEPEAAEEQSPAEEPAGEPEPAAEQDAAPQAEPSEESKGGAEDPKERRRLERSRASGPARPARTPEQRATERAVERRASKERRRRYRAARRTKRGEPGSGTPAAAREPGAKKVRQGTVVSAGAEKTITVEIAVVRRHPTYEKVVRRTSKLHAHDEANQAQQGDVVRVVESRPLSRTKRWRLLEVLERAPR
jgi:small subunit ribosomal protein S17